MKNCIGSWILLKNLVLFLICERGWFVYLKVEIDSDVVYGIRDMLWMIEDLG